MALLAPIILAQAGVSPSYTAATAGGDAFPNNLDERTFFIVKNGGGSTITVSINPQITSAKVSGLGTLPVSPVSVSVAASGEKWIGPFPSSFTDSAGNVNVTYSAVTSVTVAAVKVPALSY